jgi:hypothetical protein
MLCCTATWLPEHKTPDCELQRQLTARDSHLKAAQCLLLRQHTPCPHILSKTQQTAQSPAVHRNSRWHRHWRTGCYIGLALVVPAPGRRATHPTTSHISNGTTDGLCYCPHTDLPCFAHSCTTHKGCTSWWDALVADADLPEPTACPVADRLTHRTAGWGGSVSTELVCTAYPAPACIAAGCNALLHTPNQHTAVCRTHAAACSPTQLLPRRAARCG